MKLLRKCFVHVLLAVAAAFSVPAHAGLSPDALTIDIWQRPIEFTYEWYHSEYKNGFIGFDGWTPGTVGPFYFSMDGNNLKFEARGELQGCGTPCFIHIRSTGDKVVAAWLDQQTAEAGYKSKLGLNTFTNTDFSYFAWEDPTGIWLDLTDGYPPGRQFTISVATVPEPETYAMLLAGLGLMGVLTRRRKQV